jgi:ATP-binding cassette subfamily F protein uup
MQYTPINKLSGGEKKRLYLLKVLAAAPNVLLLDEITNDIDIPTLTILEDYLDSFGGIVIAVSHDRYFLDNLADRIFAFEDGTLVQYEGGYTDYLEAKERKGIPAKAEAMPETKKKTSGKDWKQNRPTKLKFTFKEQREFETIDEDIAALEDKIAALEEDILKNATNSGKLNELTKEKTALEETLEEKMDRWVYLNDLNERIEQEKAGKTS